MRASDEEGTTGPIEDLVDLPVDHQEPSRVLKIGKNLPDGVCEVISSFLGQNLDVFAWAHLDMEGIDPSVMSHRLNDYPNRKLVRQKRRAMDTKRYQALKEDVDKLLSNGFIKESFYHSWLANPVLVKKPNGKWRTCVDFTDLNKAYPKDSFLLSRIDQLVDATSGHALLSSWTPILGTTRFRYISPTKNTLPSLQTAGYIVIRLCRSISRTLERPTNVLST